MGRNATMAIRGRAGFDGSGLDEAGLGGSGSQLAAMQRLCLAVGLLATSGAMVGCDVFDEPGVGEGTGASNVDDTASASVDDDDAASSDDDDNDDAASDDDDAASDDDDNDDNDDDDDDDDDDDGDDDDATEDDDDDMVSGPTLDDGGDEAKLPEEFTFVFSALTFEKVNDEGKVVGFDLDKRVSDSKDAESCGKPDFKGVDGADGVDNQLATLVPVLDTISDGAVYTLISDAIEEGSILIAASLTGVDDLMNDDAVTVTLFTAEGRPLVDAERKFVAWQTLGTRADATITVTTNASIRDGVLRIGPVDHTVVANVLYFTFLLPFERLYLEMPLGDGEQFSGMLGGTLSRDVLQSIVTQADGGNGGGISQLVDPILKDIADMDWEGGRKCASISAGLSFKAARVFRTAPVPAGEEASE